MKFNYYFLFFLTLISFNLSGQKKEKITYKADELKFRRIDKEPVRKLIGNVIFIQGNTEIKCDSANFYNRKNNAEVFVQNRNNILSKNKNINFSPMNSLELLNKEDLSFFE